MKNKLKLSLIALLLSFIAISGCNDDTEELTVSRPGINASTNALYAVPGNSETFTVEISAAGRIRNISAETTIGQVALEEIQGTGNTTGSARVVFTAPDQPGTGQITITVSDEADQTAEVNVSVEIEEAPPVVMEAGEVSGTWEAGNTYIVRGDLVVPAGASLTIEEGVTVIIDGDGSQGSPEIAVLGNIYSRGTAENRVRFTVPEDKRTEANIFTGLWGGIICTSGTEEAVFLYTDIEFAGAPAGPNSTTVDIGELDEGDYRYAIYFENEEGKLILQHSRIAYTPDDGIVLNGGQMLIAHNTFEFNGRVGGEGMNVNSGTVGDIAYNIFYRPATNGVKWDNKGGKSPQTDVNIYNNTIIGGGWRQEKSGRGGSLNVQRDGRGMVYNNMIVNSRFGVRLREDQLPDLDNVLVGYNYHYGNHEEIAAEFYPSAGMLLAGEKETEHDIAGAAGENDPAFANFDVTAFDHEAARTANAHFMGDYDFSLSSGSQALGIGKTDFSPKLSSLSVQGETYSAPAPADFIGAKGN